MVSSFRTRHMSLRASFFWYSAYPRSSVEHFYNGFSGLQITVHKKHMLLGNNTSGSLSDFHSFRNVEIAPGDSEHLGQNILTITSPQRDDVLKKMWPDYRLKGLSSKVRQKPSWFVCIGLVSMRVSGNQAQIKVAPDKGMSKEDIQIIWNFRELSSAHSHSSADCNTEIFTDFP